MEIMTDRHDLKHHLPSISLAGSKFVCEVHLRILEMVFIIFPYG